MSCLRNVGSLEGHKDWVTCIACSSETPNQIISGSRDKSLIVWDLEKTDDVEGLVGAPHRRLCGHENFVTDIDISGDGQYVFSGSWDHSARLWEISTGKTASRFQGHTSRVLSVGFSPDNRQLVTASQDRTIRHWNTVGTCVNVLAGSTSHSDWVNCVKISQEKIEGTEEFRHYIISGGADRKVQVYDVQEGAVAHTLTGHEGVVNCLDVAPDSSLCASGSKDGKVILWGLKEGVALDTIDAGDEVLSITFSPTRYWLCAGTTKGIKIWDLTSKELVSEDIVEVGGEKPRPARTLAVRWSADGNTLYTGHDDSRIRAWAVQETD
ncbi:WD domain G-beta repeat [Carpediemonas membranifera]|uniref:WD domain G-beta repeat n=1 Tax=Carpediemonas membranifera TaxID=201153 RepID=A0A8J6ARW9_9EUKA|nr:WD domain G-beta repeat [Carpediemonas membranifera]|eukprot:KAG9389895.1 WD domain G-beta repeat [Carpediemonas membranifera]